MFSNKLGSIRWSELGTFQEGDNTLENETLKTGENNHEVTTNGCSRGRCFSVLRGICVLQAILFFLLVCGYNFGSGIFGYNLVKVNEQKQFIFEKLHWFVPYASNGLAYPELVIRGSGILPNQMIELTAHLFSSTGVSTKTGAPIVVESEVCSHFSVARAEIERIGNLFRKYESDKKKHGYHCYYGFILKSLMEPENELSTGKTESGKTSTTNRVLEAGKIEARATQSSGKTTGDDDKVRILEIGLGTRNPSLPSAMSRCKGGSGCAGGSNRAFRDFSDGSVGKRGQIYGADIDKAIIYDEERIRRAWVDQLQNSTFYGMMGQLGLNGGPNPMTKQYPQQSSTLKNSNSISSQRENRVLDLIIDDGLHSLSSELNVLLFGLRHIRKNGWIVIEDIADASLPFWRDVVGKMFEHSNAENSQTYLVRTDCWSFIVRMKG